MYKNFLIVVVKINIMFNNKRREKKNHGYSMHRNKPKTYGNKRTRQRTFKLNSIINPLKKNLRKQYSKHDPKKSIQHKLLEKELDRDLDDDF